MNLNLTRFVFPQLWNYCVITLSLSLTLSRSLHNMYMSQQMPVKSPLHQISNKIQTRLLHTITLYHPMFQDCPHFYVHISCKQNQKGTFGVEWRESTNGAAFLPSDWPLGCQKGIQMKFPVDLILNKQIPPCSVPLSSSNPKYQKTS